MHLQFLSTPPGWRATTAQSRSSRICSISIHAPRVEGDISVLHIVLHFDKISIHALRVEGDRKATSRRCLKIRDFYPRPPSGGRRKPYRVYVHALQFLSTPSEWRATALMVLFAVAGCSISIHALRVEGDREIERRPSRAAYFYPRPPSGGRPILSRYTHESKRFLSTPSEWRATLLTFLIIP